jgi:AraC family transcriptional regulator, melibiose operon regulatory protein
MVASCGGTGLDGNSGIRHSFPGFQDHRYDMARDLPTTDTSGGVPSHERHFYAQSRAVGRFGMRIFTPTLMAESHWHGHVEANFLTGASMTYHVDGQDLQVPENRLVLFWAGLPHQLTAVTPTGTEPPRLANIYLPLDAFLFLPHIAPLQVALLGGGIPCVPPTACRHGIAIIGPAMWSGPRS